MNAIEVRGLTKTFGSKAAVSGLDMTVPVGAIYGFIGENGSGKSTTEKMICGLLNPTGGSIKLFGRDYTDADVRAGIGVLIEAPGCFPHMTVWNNMKLQAANLGMKNADDEIRRILSLVRMEGSAGNKYKNCSLGMKQRIGIAMALIGNPKLLVLDEPINGLDADGMRIMREVLTDLSEAGVTIVVSSHLLGELEKIATHYGIIRGGRMLCEMTAEDLDASCRTYVALRVEDNYYTMAQLVPEYKRVTQEENGEIRVYDAVSPEEIVGFLYSCGIVVSEVRIDKVSLEEYYIDLMGERK